MPMRSAPPASGFAALFQLTWQYLSVMHSFHLGRKQKHSTTKTTGGRRALQAYNSYLQNSQDTGTNALLEAMKKPGVRASSASGTLLLLSQHMDSEGSQALLLCEGMQILTLSSVAPRQLWESPVCLTSLGPATKSNGCVSSCLTGQRKLLLTGLQGHKQSQGLLPYPWDLG